MIEAWTLLAQDPGNDAGALGNLFAGATGLLCGAIFGLPWLILAVSAVIHAARNPRLDSSSRMLWILVSLFVGCIGPILYFVIGAKGRSTPAV